MSYYNRKKLLLNTLNSFKTLYNKRQDLEVIIVDDASDPKEQVDEIVKNFSFAIEIVKVVPNTKTWINPCIPNNIGFARASGDVIIIQNPENIHRGDIIKSVLTCIKENTYLNYACYSIDRKITNQINEKFPIPVNQEIAHKNGTNGWYNHSKIKPMGYHFCSAITKQDLYALGGFDERFANGLAYDDNEFLCRIKKKGMTIKYIDNPFVIHQFHESVASPDRVPKGMRVNYQIYEQTMQSDEWDVKKHNQFYR
jgi:GT2 family glycosyltransferase